MKKIDWPSIFIGAFIGALMPYLINFLLIRFKVQK